jgi:hypothetical protein
MSSKNTHGVLTSKRNTEGISLVELKRQSSVSKSISPIVINRLKREHKNNIFQTGK